MPDLLFVARFVHIVTGLGWLGEVLTVNLVLLPALVRVEPALRGRILLAVFPLVFRLATALAGTAVVSGAVVFWIMSDGDPTKLVSTTWGQRILVGGLLAGPLFLFHLFQESRMEGSLAHRLAAIEDDPVASDRVLRHLQVIPRVGLAILVVSVLFMSAAARLG